MLTRLTGSAMGFTGQDTPVFNNYPLTTDAEHTFLTNYHTLKVYKQVCQHHKYALAHSYMSF